MKYSTLTAQSSTRVLPEYDNRRYFGALIDEPKQTKLEHNKKARERYKKQKL